MAKISINVRGSHSIKLPPERATVSATLSREGSSAAPVFEAVLRSLAQVRASLEAIHDVTRGPVRKFAFDQVVTSARRPWHEKGKQLPFIHAARVTVTAEFVEFAELGRWITAMSQVEGLTIHGIGWDLTESNRSETERKARQEAVRQAKARAQDYADALELGPVAPRRISDPGVLAQPMHAPMMRLAAASDALPELDLEPQDIDIHAEVEAQFVT
ncbi:SIMPL domain-containing protein [Smaragdicoccus niigatensis]|uniref:SIMPL domain-containing protein n=1 Tax=Smaragdicoccus niigatensis TaxID=359359 RepID=UPI00035C5C11|nr:SIMPL domain-containing protein [Smaragdicoccus niigatensis]